MDSIPTTGIFGKICKSAKHPRGCFLSFPTVFEYIANNLGHWDGNPWFGIANLYDPKQSQPQPEACCKESNIIHLPGGQPRHRAAAGLVWGFILIEFCIPWASFWWGPKVPKSCPGTSKFNKDESRGAQKGVPKKCPGSPQVNENEPRGTQRGTNEKKINFCYLFPPAFGHLFWRTFA